MARKSDDSAVGLLIIIVIVVYPFVWLYEKVGAFWFWVIVIGLPVSALVGWITSLGQQSNELVRTESEILTEDFSSHAHDADVNYFEYIEDTWKRGDFDAARKMLQKIAYSMVGKDITKEEKDYFTGFMADFAREDPLYKDVMLRLLPIVSSNPGMLQSKIYEGQPDDIKEQMRYVLYFANELGHIRRVKKGNSYQLFAANSPL
jgi:hypothetical protein